MGQSLKQRGKSTPCLSCSFCGGLEFVCKRAFAQMTGEWKLKKKNNVFEAYIGMSEELKGRMT